MKCYMSIEVPDARNGAELASTLIAKIAAANPLSWHLSVSDAVPAAPPEALETAPHDVDAEGDDQGEQPNDEAAESSPQEGDGGVLAGVSDFERPEEAEEGNRDGMLQG